MPHSHQAPVSVFYFYARQDEALRDTLAVHLRLLKREGRIIEWYDREVIPGTDWAKTIDEHINTASLILLLISPDFLASDYCYEIEMKRALERHQRDEAQVLPIVLRPREWKQAPFAHLQALPSNGKPVTTWSNQVEAFLMIAQGLRQAIDSWRQSHQSPSPLSALHQKNRTNFLSKVHEIWITTFLEQSLEQEVWIELGLEERRDLLPNPWRFEVQEMEQVPHSLPIGTTVEQVFDQTRQGQLLIVGEPGSGKTTQLLHLARSLIERARQSEQQPVPAVFNLSSWAQKRLSLAAWLTEELHTKYEVPQHIGQIWVQDGHLLPLLDGLDEVSVGDCSACVEAINIYLQSRLDQGQEAGSVVICCRSKDYNDLIPRLVVQRAIRLLPLSDEQIDSYFQHGGTPVETLWQAVREDSELHELTRHKP